MAVSIDDLMASYALQIGAFLHKAGYKIDFSPESLAELDRFFDEQAPGGQARPKGLLARELGIRLMAIGAYAGEVVRMKVGGTWVGDPDDPEMEIKVHLDLPDGITVFPTQRVMKRYRQGPENSLRAWGHRCGLPPTRPAAAPRGWVVPDEGEGELEALPLEIFAKPSLVERLWLDRPVVQIGLVLWVLMAFIGGWYPPLAVISLLIGLVGGCGMVLMSWWSAFRYAWKNEPGFCLFFLFPFYFIRYAILTLPHTRRAVWLLTGGLGTVIGSLVVLMPIQMLGAYLAGNVGKPKPAIAVVDNGQAPRIAPAVAPGNGPPAARGAPDPTESDMFVPPPPGAPPFTPPGVLPPPGSMPPPGFVPPPGFMPPPGTMPPPGYIPPPGAPPFGLPGPDIRRPRQGDQAAHDARVAALRPKSIDEAIRNVDSTDGAVRRQALEYLKETPRDAGRPDVAEKLLAMAKVDPERVTMEALLKWSGPEQFAGLGELLLRVPEYQATKVLKAMMAIDREKTLDLCGELLGNRSLRTWVKMVMGDEKEASERVLISRLSDPDRDVRYAAADVLRGVGTSKSLPALEAQIAREGDATVKRTMESVAKSISRRNR